MSAYIDNTVTCGTSTDLISRWNPMRNRRTLIVIVYVNVMETDTETKATELFRWWMTIF